MSIRTELMERDGYLYEVEITDENTIGSVKPISGQSGDMPAQSVSRPQIDYEKIAEKMRKTADPMRTILSQEGGAQFYQDERYIDPNWTPPPLFEYSLVNYLNHYDEMPWRIETTEQYGVPSLSNTAKWQYQDQIRKATGDSDFILSDAAWNQSRAKVVLDSLENEVFDEGFEFNPVPHGYLGGKAQHHPSIGDLIHGYTNLGARQVDQGLFEIFDFLSDENKADIGDAGPLGIGAGFFSDVFSDIFSGLNLGPLTERQIVIESGPGQSYSKFLSRIGSELGHTKQFQGRPFNAWDFLANPSEYYSDKGLRYGEASGELPGGVGVSEVFRGQLKGLNKKLTEWFEGKGKFGKLFGSSSYYKDPEHPEFWAHQGAEMKDDEMVSRMRYKGYGHEAPIHDVLFQAALVDAKRRYESGEFNYEQYKNFIKDFDAGSGAAPGIVTNRYKDWISPSPNIEDYAVGSPERKAEYDRRGWAYDETIY